MSDPAPAPTSPLFVLYFPEHIYGEGKGHYQAIEPVRQSQVLDQLKEQGGFDVAAHLGFSGKYHPVDRSLQQFWFKF